MLNLQTLTSLITEMRAIARGEITAPPDAATPSAESAEAVIRLVTPESRDLLRNTREQNLNPPPNEST